MDEVIKAIGPSELRKFQMSPPRFQFTILFAFGVCRRRGEACRGGDVVYRRRRAVGINGEERAMDVAILFQTVHVRQLALALK